MATKKKPAAVKRKVEVKKGARTKTSVKKEPKPMGRPSAWTEKVGQRICEELIAGKSLRTICKADDLPDISTVIRWLADDKHTNFRAQYAHAKEVQAEILAAETIEIADDSADDFMPGKDGPVYNAEHVQRSKLRVDARKWYASKLAPKKYGDKIAVGGADDLPPIQTKELTDAERAVRLAAFLNRAPAK